MHHAVKSGYTSEQFMTASITIRLAYDTETSMLKTAHLKPFSDESVMAKIFILLVDNKIADAVEASENRKIRYEMSLFRGSVAE